jgi:hypothetical protein
MDRLSFATAPALYAALWLSAGIVLATWQWITPSLLIAACLLFSLLSLLAARSAPRIALLPAACTWVALGCLLTEIEPAPDPQTQLRLLADQGGTTAVVGEVIRTTPVRLTESTSPFGNSARAERSESLDLRVSLADGRPVSGGLRATVFGPEDQPFPAIRCGDQIRALVAMHVPERYLDPGFGMPPHGCDSKASGWWARSKPPPSRCNPAMAALPAGFTRSSRPAANV